jgi:integrase/recombinase XerD
MKHTDFSKLLTTYLTEYLPSIQNVSGNTISSYCDTFRLFLKFYRDFLGFSIEKLSINNVSCDSIHKFLNWLEVERNCSIATRNQRLAAVHSFFRYVQAEAPQNLLLCQKILDIPNKRKSKLMVKYLTPADIKIILEQPNVHTSEGRRDLVLLSLLYDTGARVQELVDLSVRDIRLDHPAKIQLTGKGRKSRWVPILQATVDLVKRYLNEQKLTSHEKYDYPLFCNRQRKRLTRAGV